MEYTVHYKHYVQCRLLLIIISSKFRTLLFLVSSPSPSSSCSTSPISPAIPSFPLLFPLSPPPYAYIICTHVGNQKHSRSIVAPVQSVQSGSVWWGSGQEDHGHMLRLGQRREPRSDWSVCHLTGGDYQGS